MTITARTQQSGGTSPAGSAQASVAERCPDPSHLATARCVARLQRRYRQDNPAAVATLARLRRGAGRTAYDHPDHWGCDGLEDLAEILEPQDQGACTYPWVNREDAEQAVHLAVTLWALHQQSLRDADMYVPGWTLGRAVRFLAREKAGAAAASEAPESGAGSDRTDRRTGARDESEMSEPLRKRFVRIGTSTSLDAVAVRLREMVLLLRDARVPLDHGRLAEQLYAWQDERQRSVIRRAWGREFHLAFRQDVRGSADESRDAEGAWPTPSSEGYSAVPDDMDGSGE